MELLGNLGTCSVEMNDRKVIEMDLKTILVLVRLGLEAKKKIFKIIEKS